MKETLTIVPEDGTIGIDGNFLLDIDRSYLSWIPENVKSFHWYVERNSGEICFSAHPFDVKPPNERVNELGIFEQAITVFHEELDRRAQAEAEKLAAFEASRDYYQELRDMRNTKLYLSDWTQLPDAPLSPEKKLEWEVYRNILRDLPENIEDPKPLVLDENHPSWPIPPS